MPGSGARVAASVGPYGAILHDGSEYRGRYGRTHRQLVDFHRERLDVLAATAPDLLAIETIPDVDEAAALVDVLADHPDLPAWMSFSAADDARTCAGQPIEEAVAVASSSPTVMALGINCTDPRHVRSLVERMRAATSLPIVVYPNAGGEWDASDGLWHGATAEGCGASPRESCRAGSRPARRRWADAAERTPARSAGWPMCWLRQQAERPSVPASHHENTLRSLGDAQRPQDVPWLGRDVARLDGQARHLEVGELPTLLPGAADELRQHEVAAQGRAAGRRLPGEPAAVRVEERQALLRGECGHRTRPRDGRVGLMHPGADGLRTRARQRRGRRPPPSVAAAS